MLPSIGGASKRVSMSAEPTAIYTYYKSEQQRKSSDKTVTETANDTPILPIIREGSLPSLVSSNSSKTVQRSKELKRNEDHEVGVLCNIALTVYFFYC